MNFSSWQEITAVVLVTGALLLLVRRAVLLVRNPEKGGCAGGGCGNCPAEDSYGSQQPLIELKVPDSSRALPVERREDSAPRYS